MKIETSGKERVVDNLKRTRTFKHGQLKDIIYGLKKNDVIECSNKKEYDRWRQAMYEYRRRFTSRKFLITVTQDPI